MGKQTGRGMMERAEYFLSKAEGAKKKEASSVSREERRRVNA